MDADYSPQILEILTKSGVPFREGTTCFTTRCLNPVHPDVKGRDMKIFRSSGRAYCFSCKYSLSLEELSSNLKVEIPKANVPSKPFVSIRDQYKGFTGLDLPAEYTLFTGGYEKLFITKFLVRDFNIGYCSNGISTIKNLQVCSNCPYSDWVDSEDFDHCEFACGRIMIPISRENKLLSIESRDLTKLAFKKVLYPVGSKSSFTIFNYDNLDRNQPLIVVEGIKSALKIYGTISTNVTAIFSNVLKGLQSELIKEFQDVILIPDVGRAGDETIDEFHKLGLNRLRVVYLPHLLLCKNCGHKCRGDKGINCPKCSSDDVEYMDAFDFETDTLKGLIESAGGVKIVVKRRKSSKYETRGLRKFLHTRLAKPEKV